MSENVIFVTPNTPMSKLRDVLRDNRISGTPVLRNKKLVGIISVEDYIKWLCDNEPDCPIAERMTEKTIFVYDDEPLIRAFNKLENLGFGRLPVLKRKTSTISGIITKGDIITGMLKRLDVDYREHEMHIDRPDYIFDNITADKCSLFFEYHIDGGNFNKAGTSASGLKTTLKLIGVSPKIIRRTTIATYEAEMNLIFYTDGGNIKAVIKSDSINVIISDSGPGIPDVEKAMQPGYSTAPEWVRELGFGAGMGLNNIKNCTDKMHIKSEPGKGTTIELEIIMDSKNGTK